MFSPSEHSPRDPRHARDANLQNSRSAPRASLTSRARVFATENEGPPIHGAWLVAPMLLLALAAGMRLAMGGADSNFSLSFALLLGLGVAWVATRLSLPLPEPPACPHCKRKSLVRLDPLQSAGARCLHCGWRDEAADARRLSALVAAETPFRGVVHVVRVPLSPRNLRPGRRGMRGDRGDGRFGDRPPRGPSGRGRRLR